MRLKGLFGIHAKSPFLALQTHGRYAVEAASHLPDIMSAFVEARLEERKRLHKEIKRAEKEADAVKNELRSALPKGMLLPVDRRDFLDFLSAQDDIADTCRDLARLMSFRPIEVPENVGAALMKLAERTDDVMQVYSTLVEHLSVLFSASFRGPAAEEILVMIEDTGRAESVVDLAQCDTASLIYSKVYPGDPIDVLLLSKIGVRTSRVADAAERSANRLRVMLSL